MGQYESISAKYRISSYILSPQESKDIAARKLRPSCYTNDMTVTFAIKFPSMGFIQATSLLTRNNNKTLTFSCTGDILTKPNAKCMAN